MEMFWCGHVRLWVPYSQSNVVSQTLVHISCMLLVLEVCDVKPACVIKAGKLWHKSPMESDVLLSLDAI